MFWHIIIIIISARLSIEHRSRDSCDQLLLCRENNKTNECVCVCVFVGRRSNNIRMLHILDHDTATVTFPNQPTNQPKSEQTDDECESGAALEVPAQQGIIIIILICTVNKIENSNVVGRRHQQQQHSRRGRKYVVYVLC